MTKQRTLEKFFICRCPSRMLAARCQQSHKLTLVSGSMQTRISYFDVTKHTKIEEYWDSSLSLGMKPTSTGPFRSLSGPRNLLRQTLSVSNWRTWRITSSWMSVFTSWGTLWVRTSSGKTPRASPGQPSIWARQMMTQIRLCFTLEQRVPAQLASMPNSERMEMFGERLIKPHQAPLLTKTLARFQSLLLRYQVTLSLRQFLKCASFCSMIYRSTYPQSQLGLTSSSILKLPVLMLKSTSASGQEPQVRFSQMAPIRWSSPSWIQSMDLKVSPCPFQTTQQTAPWRMNSPEAGIRLNMRRVLPLSQLSANSVTQELWTLSLSSRAILYLHASWKSLSAATRTIQIISLQKRKPQKHSSSIHLVRKLSQSNLSNASIVRLQTAQTNSTMNS